MWHGNAEYTCAEQPCTGILPGCHSLRVLNRSIRLQTLRNPPCASSMQYVCTGCACWTPVPQISSHVALICNMQNLRRPLQSANTRRALSSVHRSRIAVSAVACASCNHLAGIPVELPTQHDIREQHISCATACEINLWQRRILYLVELLPCGWTVHQIHCCTSDEHQDVAVDVPQNHECNDVFRLTLAPFFIMHLQGHPPCQSPHTTIWHPNTSSLPTYSELDWLSLLNVHVISFFE